MKNLKMGTKISVTIFITLSVGLVILWAILNARMTGVMRDQTIARLTEATESRTALIDKYLENAEMFYKGYGQSDAVTNLLKNPNNKEYQDVAFTYSKRYASIMEDLEGLYIADMDTKMLYHSNLDAIGSLASSDEGSRKELISNLFSSKEVYSTGILVSPVSGKEVLADYYPIYDEDGTTLGMVGGGIFTQKLMNQLNDMSLQGLENSKYYLLDLNNNSYIFSTDTELIGKAIENKDHVKMAKTIMAQTEVDTTTYEFEDSATGNMTLAVYKNIPDKGWAFVFMDTHEEAYASSYILSRVLLTICANVLVVVSLVSFFMARFIAKDLISVGKIITEIGSLDLTQAKRLNIYGNRKDEIGIIAKATIKLSDAVTTSVFALKDKEAELLETSDNLLDTSKQTNESVSQVDSAIQEIAKGATSQATETERATTIVLELGDEIADTVNRSNKVRESAKEMMSLSNEAMTSLVRLHEINEEAVDSIHVIYDQTNTTNHSAQKIKEATNLITSISEETNLLSLNASIEAARAGEQGRGFAVVAAQIQKLAEQSNSSATQIDNIINSLITDSTKAVETMEKVNNIMIEQSDCVDKTKDTFIEVKEKLDDLLGGVGQITEKIINIDGSRGKIIDVVQGLSAIAQENAASAEETSASTSVVNEMTLKISESSVQLKEIATDISNQVGVFTV